MNIMPDRKATVNIEGRDLTLQKGTVFEGDEVVGHYDQKKRSGQIWSKPISIMKGWILHMM
jgi:sensor domain CHASE-containing protein